MNEESAMEQIDEAATLVQEVPTIVRNSI